MPICPASNGAVFIRRISAQYRGGRNKAVFMLCAYTIALKSAVFVHNH